MTNWGNHKGDTMAKVQHFSGISKRIPFEGFDFYDLFRVTFENSELGRMKRLLPLHEMAVNFGLVSACLYGRKRIVQARQVLLSSTNVVESSRN